MHVTLTPAAVEVRLSTYEKIGALRRDLAIPRERIVAARVDAQPLRSIRGGFTIGLRVPGLRYVCWGRHFWAIRRGVPALHLRLRDDAPGRLREVTVSTPDAHALAASLTQRPAA